MPAAHEVDRTAGATILMSHRVGLLGKGASQLHKTFFWFRVFSWLLPPPPSNCNCHFKSEVKQTCSSVLLQLDSESSRSPLPNWERLLDCDIIIAYMDKLKHFKIKADGRTSKLDALDAGLTFMRHNLCKDDPKYNLSTCYAQRAS